MAERRDSTYKAPVGCESGTNASASAPAGRVAVDLPCHRCGYNLRTLERWGRCPECGQFVRESLNMWFTGEPPWLARVAEGAALLTLALALLVLVILGTAIQTWGHGGPGWAVALAVLGVLGLTAGILGAPLLTMPPPVRAYDRELFGRWSPRRLVRACLVGMVASLALLAAVNSVPYMTKMDLGDVLMVLAAVPWLVLVTSVLLIFPALAFHVTALIRHTRNRRWQRRARVCAWGITLAEIAGAVVLAWDAGAVPGLPPPTGPLAGTAFVAPLIGLIALGILVAGSSCLLDGMRRHLLRLQLDEASSTEKHEQRPAGARGSKIA
jgi:hypothetical protein